MDRAGSTVEAHTAEGVIEIAQVERHGVRRYARRIHPDRLGARGAVPKSARDRSRQDFLGSVAGADRAWAAFSRNCSPGAHLEDSSLVAGSGDITVLIPSNLALSVLARNDSGANPRIVSDFSELRARSIAPARPAAFPMVYQGSINGGGPLLTLTTAGGIIYVKKSK